jgi:glycerophosphoryl diester phosphodiesterase
MVLIEAHRICGRLAPENSREAVDVAWRLGYVHSVEFDVRGTLDGQVVVFHGPELATDERVARYIDLENLENGESVPLFGEIFHLCAEKGLEMNIEIKDNDDQVIREVIEAIIQSDAKKSAKISSFDRDVLEKVRRREQHIRLGLLVNDWRECLNGVPICDEVPKDFASFHETCGVPFKGDSVNFCAAAVTKEVVKICTEAELEAMVWFPGDETLAISDEHETNLVNILNMKPNVICTNRPDLLAKILMN